MPNLSKSPLITTGLLWIIAGLIAWPMGDFPLDDDWSYAEAVKHWVDTGTYWVSDWPAMTLFTQVIWGGVFAKVFGFSFTILRWSTLVIGAIGIWAFRQTLVQLKFPDHWQLLVLLTLVFNPLFFELSFTFMTDIPFLSLMAIALYAYLNAFETNQFKWWATATLACILSILLRQMALLLPICMGIALLLGKPRLQTFGWALGSTLLTYLSLKGYIFWQEHTPTGLPAAFGKPEQLLSILSWDYISGKVSQLSGLYLLYLGGMLLPVSLLTAWRPRQPIALGLSLLATGAGLIAIKHSWAEPLLGNTINQWGLGTTPLAGDRSAEHWPSMPQWLGLPVKGLAVAGALLIILYGTSRLTTFLQQYLRQLKISQPYLTSVQTFKLGVLGFLVAYGAFLLVNTFHFDRYILPLLLGSLLLLRPAPKRKKSLTGIAALLLFLMGLFSIAGTHDYFAWNRARWNALHSVMEAGVSPTKIDGGVEFNGWYRTAPRSPNVPYAKNWWFVEDDTYTVSFGPFANYQVQETYPFQRWLSQEADTIFLLRKPDWSGADTLRYTMEPSSWPDYQPYAQIRSSELAQLEPTGHDSLNYAYAMEADQAYGLTHQLFPVAPFEEIQFSIAINQESGLPKIVIAAPDPDQFHHALQLFPSKQTNDSLTIFEATMRIPGNFPSDTLSFYFWKPTHNRILLDNYQVIWKQLPPH